MFKMVKNFIIFFLFLSSCASTWKDKIYKKDKDFILKGRYPYQANSLGREGGDYSNFVEKLRKEIEKDPEIFDKIVHTYFEIYYPPFKYHITMLDKERNNLIIRYFARFLTHKIYAGIMIQFVYNLKERKMSKIYVDLIPLE